MNKKAIITLVAAMSMTLAARADLLYFLTTAFDWSGPKNYDYCMVGVAKDGVAAWNDGQQVYLQIQATPGSGVEKDIYLAADDARYTAGPAWADVTDYTADGYTFYVETYENGALDPIWTYNETTAKSYATLLKEKHIYTEGTSLPDVTPWVVPEPSSGMMALLGFALLALRRKRV